MGARLRSYVRRSPVAYIAIIAILALAGTAGAASSVLTGHGQRKQVRYVVAATSVGFLGTPKTLAKIPGMGKLKLSACFDSSGDNSVREQFISSTDSTLDVIVDSISWELPSGPGATSMEGSGRISGAGGGTVRAVSAPGATAGSSGRITWQISSGTGSGGRVTTIVSTILNRSPIVDQCEVAADVMLP